MLNNELTAIRDKLKSYEMQKSQLDQRNQVLEQQLKRMKVEGFNVKNSSMAEASESESLKNHKRLIEQSLKDLLKLCKGDMNETTKRLMHIAQNESIDEALRRDIIDQGRLYVQLFKSLTEYQN